VGGIYHGSSYDQKYLCFQGLPDGFPANLKGYQDLWHDKGIKIKKFTGNDGS
jgi:hypothetical protein